MRSCGDKNGCTSIWNVIGNYNKQTWIIQDYTVTFMLLLMLSYMQKVSGRQNFH